MKGNVCCGKSGPPDRAAVAELLRDGAALGRCRDMRLLGAAIEEATRCGMQVKTAVIRLHMGMLEAEDVARGAGRSQRRLRLD